MKKVSYLLTLALVLLGLSAGTALADLKPATHSGFYIGLGVGGGSLELKSDQEDEDFDLTTDRETGGAGNFRIGFALSQKFLLGLESNAWVKEFEQDFGTENIDWQLSVSNVAAAVTFYPAQYFFIKGGPALGVTSLTIDFPNSNLNYEDNASGVGFMIGVGGELRLTKKFAIVPSAQWMWQSIELDELEDFEVENSQKLDANFFSITLGVGWYW